MSKRTATDAFAVIQKRQKVSTVQSVPGRSTTGTSSTSTTTSEQDKSNAQGNSKSNITRILSWNVETPVPFLDLPKSKTGPSSFPPRPNHLRTLLKRHDFPDFVCLQEIRARYSDTSWITALTSAMNSSATLSASRDTGPKYQVAYSSLNRASTRGQRHFGVITYVKTSLPNTIVSAREVDWDIEGRVVILEMKAGWALVNVYALNGSDYTWKDPQHPDSGRQVTRHERKREFNRLLMQECKEMQKRRLKIVLVGDFNISLTKADCYPRLRMAFPHAKARKEFNEEFMPGLDLVDAYRELHGDRKGFSWFAKGKPQGQDCARVDYALVEKSLRERVEAMEYLDEPGERAHSDHAPWILDLKDMDS
ncbi:hypothetical protein EIP91_010544 [Steccherinum ochraceum]|uniref:Endonuclease/exonuclease/phosphatase domain-containing protein n=1 Tax=Steccherinum ochraceum TaxID=92696 RepID=A0A4R0R957_9APHY|nr:hypothetical protein EIP91_010544 [Steccherinum ochraceum]